MMVKQFKEKDRELDKNMFTNEKDLQYTKIG
jgi:hypothetical protein